MIIDGSPIHASQVIRPSVWMLLQASPTTAATPTKAAVHIACVETAFNPIEIPSILDPVTNIQYAGGSVGCLVMFIYGGSDIQRQNATDKTARPNWPKIKCPTSSIPYTSQCRSLKVPIVQADHVVIPATAQRQITPGIIPKASKAPGTDRIPSQIWVFIMRITAPKNPSW